MSIHDFHSKLTSGKEEGKLFQALRRISLGGPLLASGEETSVWSQWAEGTGSASGDEPTPGWSVWQEGSTEAMSQA